MTTCWACETELDRAWKYCIRCGVPVETETDAGKRKRAAALAPLVMFGWIMATISVALFIVAVVLLIAAI